MNVSTDILEAPNSSESLLFEGNVDDKLFNAYKIYYFIIDAVFIFPTVFGNVLVLIAIGRFSGLRKYTSHILMGNLAVSDLFVGVVVFPVHMLLLQNEALREHVTVCLLHHSLIYTLVGVSVMNLLLVSYERFHAITRPFTHETTFTRRKIYFTMTIVWILMFVLGFLQITTTRKYLVPSVYQLTHSFYSRF